VDYPERVRRALASLGIASGLIERRSLRLCGEAIELELAELGEDGRQFMLIPAAAQAWKDMAAAAARDGVALRLASAFRSLDRQVEILRESAPPGYSEHHTGRAVDITTPGSEALVEDFEKTEAFRWLQRRAHEFGFSLSFPRGNRFGYAYEPWHWFYQRGQELPDVA